MIENSTGPTADANLMALWAAERCPIIDGIVFGDGRIRQVLATWKEQENGRLKVVLEQGGWTTLGDFLAEDPLNWSEIIDLCAAEDPARRLRILGGEGGHGSDGFVAVLRGDGPEIVWIAFFTRSNPFEVVQIDGDLVLAKTNLGTWWRFPLAAPEQVTLQ